MKNLYQKSLGLLLFVGASLSMSYGMEIPKGIFRLDGFDEAKKLAVEKEKAIAALLVCTDG